MATTKKTSKAVDDDSYTNLMYGIGAAKKLGDTKKLEAIKKANPKAYAAFEAQEKWQAAAKKGGKK